MTLPDLGPLWLTLQLAAITTAILLAIGTPVAWWLARTESRLKPVAEAITALPLVLPPTVLGFYLLIALSPKSALGGLWLDVTGSTLTFSFIGLVIGSVFYSMPFTVQPLQVAFDHFGCLLPLLVGQHIGRETAERRRQRIGLWAIRSAC